MTKRETLIYRLTMKDYGDTPLGALDAMSDAAKRIKELEATVMQLENEIMEMKHA